MGKQLNSSLLLVGGGGHCRSCIELVESSRQFEIAGIVGLADEVGQSVLGYPILGSDDDLPELVNKYFKAVVSVGQIRSVAPRARLYDRLLALGAQLPCVRAASAVVSRHASVGQGSVVMHGAIINAGAVVGNNGIINSSALVEHDVEVGDHCHISTAAVLNGGVRVGEGSFIGSGAVVHQNVRIGRGVIIAAGAIVRRDISDHAVVRAHPSSSRAAPLS